jgi:hypothetical protein
MEPITISVAERIVKNAQKGFKQLNDGESNEAVATILRAFVPTGLDRAAYAYRSFSEGGYVDSWTQGNVMMDFNGNDQGWTDVARLLIGGKPLDLRHAQERDYSHGGKLYTETQRARFAKQIAHISGVAVMPGEGADGVTGEDLFAAGLAANPQLADDIRLAFLERYGKVYGDIKDQERKLREWLDSDPRNKKMFDEAATKGLSTSDAKTFGSFRSKLNSIIEDGILRGQAVDILNGFNVPTDLRLDETNPTVRRAMEFDADPEELLAEPWKDAVLEIWRAYDATRAIEDGLL